MACRNPEMLYLYVVSARLHMCICCLYVCTLPYSKMILHGSRSANGNKTSHYMTRYKEHISCMFVVKSTWFFYTYTHLENSSTNYHEYIYMWTLLIVVFRKGRLILHVFHLCVHACICARRRCIFSEYSMLYHPKIPPQYFPRKNVQFTWRKVKTCTNLQANFMLMRWSYCAGFSG